jgi:hypothetical protein
LVLASKSKIGKIVIKPLRKLLRGVMML